MKRCTLCKENKPFSEFHKKCRSKDGLKTRCKTCVRPIELVQHAIYRAKRSEEQIKKTRIMNKKWQTNNKDRVNDSSKRWYAKNSDYMKHQKKFLRQLRSQGISKQPCASCGTSNSIAVIIPTIDNQLITNGEYSYRWSCRKCRGLERRKTIDTYIEEYINE